MKNFSFHSPKTIKEAKKLSSSRSCYLAGGMTTIPSMKLRLAAYSDIIDIKKIKDLSGIKTGKTLTVGATTTHFDVSSSKEVKKSIPSLAILADGIGDPQVRNRGTIGGSIANNDPAADYPSACLALDATVHTNERKIPADKFFKRMFETALKKGELIEKIEFQIPEKSCYIKFPNPASRYALVGVYVAKYKKEVRAAVTGASSCVFRSKEIESALSNNFSVSSLENIKVLAKELNSDLHASSEYRAHLIGVMAKKAVAGCK